MARWRSILPKVGATNVSLVTFVAPISAALIGATLFGEVLQPNHFAGMALILAGLVALDGRLWRLIAAIAGAARVAAPRLP